MIYIIIILALALPGVSYLSFIYGKKKSLDDFLTLLFQNGFDSKVEAFRVLNKYIDKKGIVFVGDSITQDYNVYEYFSNHQVYNRGIGGDTSVGLLKRLDVSIDALEPSKVFIQIGTNDFELLDANPLDIFNAINLVVKHINKKFLDAQVYVISIYPVNPLIDSSTVGKRNNEDIKKTNELLSTLKGCIYIDIYDKLILDDQLNQLYTLEGLHLNQKGYEVLTKALEPYVKS